MSSAIGDVKCRVGFMFLRVEHNLFYFVRCLILLGRLESTLIDSESFGEAGLLLLCP